MTLRTFCRSLPLFVVLVCSLAVSAAGDRRSFGPEWKKTHSQSEWAKAGFDYERTVNVTFHHSSGNVAGFQLPLESGDTVWGYEVDGDSGSNVEIRSRQGVPYGGFEVTKGPNGKPESFTVSVGPNRYYDLDADGVFDAMYDHRSKSGRVPMILFDGRFVPIRDQLSLFSCARGETLKVRGIGLNEEYEFTKGRWNLVK
jgi:hypothetical protein